MPASRIACLLPGATKVASADRKLAALADVAAGFSPQVERSNVAVYLEVGDLGRLFPTEEQLVLALQSAMAEVEIAAHIAIASDKGVARAMAYGLAVRRQEAYAIVRCGQERESLATLPVAVLGPSAGLSSRLAAWGVRTVGDFAALPRPAAVTRLGPDGAALHRLACGESGELVVQTPPLVELCEEQELLEPIDNLEPLRFVLRGLLSRLVARLRARGQACGALTLRLHSGGARGSVETRRITIAAPTQQVAPLFSLVQLSLEQKPPSATIERVALSTVPGRTRPIQLDLFAPAGPAPERLATTLARLEALCGSGRVGQPVAPNSHSPSAAAVAVFSGHPSSESTVSPARGVLSARVFRPPWPVAVIWRQQPSAAEAFFEAVIDDVKSGGRRRAVRRNGGPCRVRDVRGARDYYDVELCSGDLLRLFHDLVADRWFLDAIYD